MFWLSVGVWDLAHAGHVPAICVVVGVANRADFYAARIVIGYSLQAVRAAVFFCPDELDRLFMS